MKKTILAGMLVVQTVLLSGAAFPATLSRITFEDSILKADAIFIGEMTEVRSFSSLDSDSPSMRLPEIDIFSVAFVKNARFIETGFQEVVVPSVPIYFDGGQIPMPEGIRSQIDNPDIGKMDILGEFNTSTPSLGQHLGESLVFMLCDNGLSEAPFCDLQIGLMKIDDSGIVRTLSGKPAVGIVNGNIAFASEEIFDTPDRAMGPKDPDKRAREGGDPGTQYLTETDLVKYVRSIRSALPSKQLINQSENIANPVLRNPEYRAVH